MKKALNKKHLLEYQREYYKLHKEKIINKVKLFYKITKEADPIIYAEKVKKYVQMQRDADPVLFHEKANLYARKYYQLKRELKQHQKLVELLFLILN